MSSIGRAESVFYDSDFGSGSEYEEEEESSISRDHQHQTTSNDSVDQDDSTTLNRRTSTYSTWSNSTSNSLNSTYLSASQRALGTLQTLHSNPDSSWKRALKHKSGTVVYVTKEKLYVGQKNPNIGGGGAKGSAEGFYAPVFKGELILENFSPPEVFKIVGTRSLWDDWYKEGYLLENLSETASLTYMCMKGIAGTSTRDLCLVEQVSATEKGEILFVSTSVNSPKVPRVDGRIRASIALNGWVLEPLPNGRAGTKITYYLHVNVKTFLPSFAAVKYLARRPTCIAKIAEYLNSHGLSEPLASVETLPTRDSSLKSGSPSTTLVNQTTTHNNNSSNERTHTNSGTMNNDSPSVVVVNRTRLGGGRKDSSASKRSIKSTTSSIGSALPFHVHPNEETNSYLDIQKAQQIFKGFLSAQGGEWKTIKGDKGVAIFVKEGNGLGVVKGERRLAGVTTEQVLGTLLSEGARKEWDPRFLSSKLINLDNGFDQGTHIEFHKSIYPSFNARHYIISQGVDREDTSTDNGTILLVSRSTKATTSTIIPKDSTRGQLELSGWFIDSPSSTSSTSLDSHLTHIVSIDPRSSTPLQPVVSKILISEIAKAPHLVAEFIDTYGFAPYFLRWGEGPAEFLGEIEESTNLKKGEIKFRIGGEGEGTMKNGEQKAWLNYSEKMFERGVDITLEPHNAATVSKVDGLSKTVEFIWNDSIKRGGGGAIVTLKRAEMGDGPEDLYLDGEFLDKTVGMEKRRGSTTGGGNLRKKVVKKDSKEGETKGGPMRNAIGSNGSPEESKVKSLSNAVVPTVASAGSTLASTARNLVAPLAPTSISQSNIPSNQSQVGQQQQQVAHKFNVPEDAVLIISKDLYFTGPQVKLILGVIAVAWLWGKFA